MSTFQRVHSTLRIVVLAALLVPGRAGLAEAPFRRGDANADGRIDLSDPVSTLGMLFLGASALPCDDASDANDDGLIDISDSLFTLIHLYLGGPDSPEPSVQCGTDPTPDGLGCGSFSPCRTLEGQSEFTTPLAGGPGLPGRGLEDGVDAAPGGVDAGGNPPSAAPARAIEESDIYKLSGNLLYVMNRYRGLQILDLSDLDHPRLLGRAPIFGYPKEMYVRGTTAYVVVSDYYSFWQDTSSLDAAVSGFHGSQLRIVDVADPTAPRLLGGIDLAGDCTDSRIVGEVLYLVTQRYPWYSNPWTSDTEDKTQVVSVRVANPGAVEVIDTADFPRNGWEHHVSVTPDRIYLASSGWTWTGERGQYDTRIRVIDISDPLGEIVIRGEVPAPGRVQDRWALDEHEGVLRVASGQTWGNGDVYLTTYSVTDPDQPRRLGQAVLHVNENLTAARFDGPRGYLVSYRNIDPLFSFDLSDPTKPRLLGELEMTGWLDFIVPSGDRLVALGHEDLTNAQGQREIRLAVSLIDVSRSSAPVLLSRVTLEGLWGWVPSSRDDFAKVFRTLPDQGLILFPYQAWSQEDWRQVGGVQLIDFDATHLTRRGLIRGAGWVERGIPHDPSVVLTLASDVFQAIDISDRDAPRVRSRLELARNVQDFALLPGNFAVQLSGDWWRGDLELVVTTTDDPDAVEPVARLHLPAPYGRLFVNGSMAYVSSQEDLGDGTRGTRVRVIDLSDPTSPRERGSVNLPEEVWAGYRSWYWGWGDEVVQVHGSTLVFHRYAYNWWWDCLACDVAAPAAADLAIEPVKNDHRLFFVDLHDPDAPVIAGDETLDTADWAWGLRAVGSRVYLSSYTSIQVKEEWRARYEVLRWDVSGVGEPTRLGNVNVPGMLVGASAPGSEVYTLESWWDGTAQRSRTLLHALAVAGDTAYLQSSLELEGYTSGVIVEGDLAVVLTQQWTPRVLEGGATQYIYRAELLTIDISSPGDLTVAGKATVPLDYGYLQALEGGKAFVGAGPGLLTFDVTDPAAPTFEKFFRTQGWAQDVIVRDDRAYVPSGWYGVQVLDL